jgi:DNA-binding response OmpR family regulator
MPPAADSTPPIRFGVFELDVHAGQLRKRGMRLSIQGLPLQVLGILLQHGGHVVTR